MKTFGGNSGYVGYSQSKRSVEAKSEGRFPKTQFKKEYGISEKMFQSLLKDGVIINSEWHHTSCRGNKTTFYAISNDLVFFVRIGQIDVAREIYKRTINYTVPVFYNKKRDKFVLDIVVKKEETDILSKLSNVDGLRFSSTKSGNKRVYMSPEALSSQLVREAFTRTFNLPTYRIY